MKIPKHLTTAALAGALASAFAMEVPAQAPSSPPAARPRHRQRKAAAAQRTFATPEEAAKALADAARTKMPCWPSWAQRQGVAVHRRPVADTNDWKNFLAGYDEKNALERKDESKAVLTVGKDIGRSPRRSSSVAHWSFDTNAGREEILNRRVGRNELDTIQTLLAIVDAQREYAASADGSGCRHARRFRSSPGRRTASIGPARQAAK